MRDPKLIFFTVLSLIFILFLTSFAVAADPVVNNIIVNPENPNSVSTFTVSADISGEGISRVNLTISGCNEDVCFTDLTQNVEMDLKSQGKYEAEITFNDPDEKANNIKYLFEIALENGTEYRFSDPSWKTYVNIDDNEDNGVNDQADDNSTPGFEFIFVLVALFISLLLYYKKR